MRRYRSDGDSVDENIGDVVARVRSNRKAGVGTIINDDTAGRADGAVRARGCCNRIGIERKGRVDGMICRDTRKRMGSRRANGNTVDKNIGAMVARVRSDRETRVGTVVNAYRARRADRAVRPRGRGDRIGVDREACVDGMSCRYVKESV